MRLCHDPRHATPCAADCRACQEECDPKYFDPPDGGTPVPTSPYTPQNLTFQQARMVDVRTAYVTEEDRRLMMLPAVPYRSHTSDGDYGAVFWLPASMEEADVVPYVTGLRLFGFSERFLGLLLEATHQGFGYVLFDSDGCDVNGIPEV